MQSLISAIISLMFLLVTVPGEAQRGEIESEPIDEWFTLEKDETPRYFLIEMFFLEASQFFEEPDGRRYEDLLKELGIEPHSKGDTLLVESIVKAKDVLETRTVDGRLEGDAFMEHQYQAVGDKAGALGRLYGRFLRDLDAAGESSGQIDQRIDERMRNTVSVGSSNGPLSSIEIDSYTKFDEQLEQGRRE